MEAEWRFFLNRKRSGKVDGNLVTVIYGDLKIDDLPPSLQNYEIFYTKPEYLKIVYNYLRKDVKPETIEFLKYKAEKYYKNNELEKAYKLFEMLHKDYNDSESAYYMGCMLSDSEDKQIQYKALGLLNIAQINGITGTKEKFEALYRYVYL